MTTQLKIGTIGYPVDEQLLYPHVDIVELQVTRRSVPKAQVATKIRSKAPSHVQFALQMPAFFFDTPNDNAKLGGELKNYGSFQTTPEQHRLFERLNRFADNLGADTLVLLTPSDFTPTPRMQDALSRFLEAMPVEERSIIWQPSGPWTDTQAARFANQNRLIRAVDPIRDDAPAGDRAYFRLGPFAAMGSRVGIYDLEQIIEKSSQYEAATIVFETEKALDDVKNIKQVLAEI